MKKLLKYTLATVLAATVLAATFSLSAHAGLMNADIANTEKPADSINIKKSTVTNLDAPKISVTEQKTDISNPDVPASNVTSVPGSSSLILMTLALAGFGFSLRKNKAK